MKSSVFKILRQKASFRNKYFFIMTFLFLAAVITGFTAVTYNAAFLHGTDIARARFNENPEIIFLITPVFFLIGAFVCRHFAPKASGSGPEHVIAALKKLGSGKDKNVNIEEYLGFRVLVAKIVSSLIGTAGGGALGREGPVLQIAASIFTIIGEKVKKKYPSLDLRTWVVAGSAAGVAAAFNTPLAGIVFVVEELSQFNFEKGFTGFKAKAFFAVIVATLTAEIVTGSYVLFDFPLMHFRWDNFLSVILLIVACCCGLIAWILKAICVKTDSWHNSIKGNSWYLVPVICGLIVATVTYNIGIHSFGAGVYVIEESLKSSSVVITLQDSIGRFINIIATIASGCAGGLLLPALALGAGIGSIGSSFMPLEDARIFVVTGMASFLGALLNAPLTAAVLVLEVTNQSELIIPVLLSTLAASWVFRNCTKGYKLIKK